jgi:hypothetical protein
MARINSWQRLQSLEKELDTETPEFETVLIIHNVVYPTTATEPGTLETAPNPEMLERKEHAISAVSDHLKMSNRKSATMVWDHRAADGLGDFELL